VRWGATIRGFFFIHAAVTRLFDKTGIKGEYRVFIRENTGRLFHKVGTGNRKGWFCTTLKGQEILGVFCFTQIGNENRYGTRGWP
jgi:hypothetical protein